MNRFFETFPSKKPIFGMLHLAGERAFLSRMFNEIRIYTEEGLSGAILENYHGSQQDLVLAAQVAPSAKSNYGFEIGINFLPNEYFAAITLAHNTGRKFIQLDFVSGTYRGAGSVDVDYYNIVRRRNPEVLVLGGVHPKYYDPVTDFRSDLLVAKSLCDAIVITGEGTGIPTPVAKLQRAREVIGDFPLLVGAGLTASNALAQLGIADGAIVGSFFKDFNNTMDHVVRSRVQELMNVVAEFSESSPFPS